MKVTYTPHHRDTAEGSLFLDKEGACTILLTGAASMPQGELDGYGHLCAAALSDEPYAYAFDPHWFNKLREVERGLHGNGSHLSPDQRRDLANLLSLVLSNAVKPQEGG